MSTVSIYIPKENGDLKYLADVEDENDAALALDAVLDEMPRVKDSTFFAVVSENDDGIGHTCILEVGDEPPARRPKRNIAVSNGVAPLASDDTEDDEPEEEPEVEAPKPKRTPARRSGGAAKKPPARKPAAAAKKPASGGRKLAKKPAASTRKKASGRKAPYTRSAKSDD